MKHVGKRYVWGATGPSTFDCSGLVVYARRQAGIETPRWASYMMAAKAKPVARKNMRPGDLVFFYTPVSHVGIYVGNNKFVHAQSAKTGVLVSSLSSRSGWFAGRL